MNHSNDRLVIPHIDEDFAVEAMKKLIEIEIDSVPSVPGTCLYVLLFILSTDSFLVVSPSNTYSFMIILSRFCAYYKEGINPVQLAVENTYVRAVLGGTGEAKTAGKYASSLI